MENNLCQNETITELLNLSEKKIENTNENSTTTISILKEEENEIMQERKRRKIAYNKLYCKEYRKLNIKRLREYNRQWRNRNKSKCRGYKKSDRKKRANYYKEYGNQYKKNHKEKTKAYNKEYRIKNKEKLKLQKQKYFQENKNCLYLWRKNKIKTDLNFRLSNLLRSRLSKIIIGKQKTGSAVRDLGCSIDFLRQYLESKFQPGMNWDNYGFYGWHIDHIKPLCMFDLTDRKQLLEACHYTNLQPLWADDNWSKNNRNPIKS